MNGVREARIEDFRAIERIVREVHALHFAARPDSFRETSLHFTEGTFAKMLEEDDDLALVAEDATHRVQGYIVVRFLRHEGHPILRDRVVCLIDDIGVEEVSRRAGIGRSLLVKALEEGRRRGAEVAELSVWAFNESARRFYESLGFAERNIRMDLSLR